MNPFEEAMHDYEDALESYIRHQRQLRAIAYLDYRTSQMERDILEHNPAMAPYLHHLNTEIINAERQGYLDSLQ